MNEQIFQTIEDNDTATDRARAELAAKLAQQGSGLNPEYISLVEGQKPVDYVDGTGVPYGSYPVSGGLLQKVKWNEGTGQWDDYGVPWHTVESTKVDTWADLGNRRGFIDGQVVELLGRNEIGDGGGGAFTWRTNSTKADDGGTVRDPFADGTEGRWERDFKGSVNVRWFGVGLDSNADDEGFQSVLNNFDNVEVTEGTTVVLSQQNTGVIVTGTKNIFGKGTIKWDGPDSSAMPERIPLYFRSEEVIQTTLSAGASVDDINIEVNSAASIEIGQLVLIESANTNPNGEQEGEISVVTDISGTTITLNDNMVFAHASGEKVRFYRKATVNIWGLNFTSVSDDLVANIRLDFIQDATVESLTYDREISASEYFGLSFARFDLTYNCVMRGCKVNKINQTTKGIGAWGNGSRHLLIHDNTFRHCREAVDFGIGDLDPEDVNVHAVSCVARDNKIIGDGLTNDGTVSDHPRGLSSHSGSIRCSFIDNDVSHCHNAFIERGESATYKGNMFSFCSAASFSTNARGVMKLEQNTFYKCGVISLGFQPSGSLYTKDNTFEENLSSYIYLLSANNGSLAEYDALVFDGFTVILQADAAARFFLNDNGLNSADVTIDVLHIHGLCNAKGNNLIEASTDITGGTIGEQSINVSVYNNL